MVPTFTCGLVRLKTSLATAAFLYLEVTYSRWQTRTSQRMLSGATIGIEAGDLVPYQGRALPTELRERPYRSISLSSFLSAVLYLIVVRAMERVMGIEPTPSAWKAEVLPLNYTRLRSGGGGRIRTYEGISQQIYSLPLVGRLGTPPRT